MEDSMHLDTNDLGVKRALETVLGHPAPFKLEELRSLKGPLKGRPVFESARVVFKSYAAMLGHIVALRLENGEVISGCADELIGPPMRC